MKQRRYLTYPPHTSVDQNPYLDDMLRRVAWESVNTGPIPSGITLTIVDAPAPFDGTDEERAANHESHRWMSDEGRCYECDSRYGSLSFDYPCGSAVPRHSYIDVPVEEA